MRNVLDQILNRADVADLLVQVTMFDDPRWPFADTIWVMTDASPAEVEGWFTEQFRPDDVCLDWQEGVTYEPYEVPNGMRPVGVFFD